MTFRIINTGEAIEGPHGIRYVHDAARPFAVLRSTGKREICAGRFSTEKSAKAAIAKELNHGVLEVEPRTAAGSLD